MPASANVNSNWTKRITAIIAIITFESFLFLCFFLNLDNFKKYQINLDNGYYKKKILSYFLFIIQGVCGIYMRSGSATRLFSISHKYIFVLECMTWDINLYWKK